MPRGSNRNRRNRSGQRNRPTNNINTVQGNGPYRSLTTRVQGNCNFGLGHSTTPSIVAISDVMATPFGSRLPALAAIFEQCRCVGLTITFLNNLADNDSTIVAFSPSLEDTVVSNYGQTSELQKCAFFLTGSTVPSRLTLTRRELMNFVPNKWFPTNPRALTQDTYQGGIFFVSNGTSSAVTQMRVDYVYEFCSPVPNGYEENKSHSPVFVKKDGLVEGNSTDQDPVPDIHSLGSFPPLENRQSSSSSSKLASTRSSSNRK